MTTQIKLTRRNETLADGTRAIAWYVTNPNDNDAIMEMCSRLGFVYSGFTCDGHRKACTTKDEAKAVREELAKFFDESGNCIA